MPDDARSRDRWDRVAYLLEQAKAVDPSRRAAFLEEQEPDRELRAEVAALLAHAEDGGSFLEQPISLQSIALDSLSGQEAGNCRLTKPVGEGGMGSVWEAVRTLDASAGVEQRVAVKVCHPGQFKPEDFQREAAALARLQHPGVAHLYDTGRLADGRPFLVMELVDGQPLDVYLTGKPEDAKLAVLMQVCEAVEAAHQAGLVHRDIKPSNILVNAAGVAKLIDFGISKRADDPVRTVDARLTPRYASPEQFRGQPATAASDIYSLGVTMYEVLTGSHPFAGKAASELVKAVCDDPAPVPALPKDLASIVLKAMAQTPNERYGSARVLAADLERYRRSEPVTAIEASAGYRTRKFLARRRVPLGIAAAVLTLVGIGFGRAYWERRESMRRFQQTHALARSLLFDVHDEVQKVRGTLESRQVILERAGKYLDQLAADRPSDTALLVDLSESFIKLGSLQGSLVSGQESLHRWRDARATYEKSLAILEHLHARVPGDRDTRVRLARNYQRIADVCMELGDGPCEAERFRQALAVYERDAKEHPEDGRAQMLWLTTRVKHKVPPLYRARKLAPAREELYSVAAAFEEVAKRHPETPQLHTHMAYTYRYLGSVEGLLGNYDTAISWYRKAHAIYLRQNDLDTASEAENNIAWTLKKQGKPSESLAAYSRVVEVRRQLLQGRGGDRTAMRRLVEALLGRATLACERKDWPRARVDAEEVLAMLAPIEKESTQSPGLGRDITYACLLLGTALWGADNQRAARVAYREFLSRVPPSLAPNSNFTVEEVEKARQRVGQGKP